MDKLKPMDDRNMVKGSTLNKIGARVEHQEHAKTIVKDIRTYEPLLDQFLTSRVDDHIEWLATNYDLEPDLIKDLQDCMYKFATMGFLIGKETFTFKEIPGGKT